MSRLAIVTVVGCLVPACAPTDGPPGGTAGGSEQAPEASQPPAPVVDDDGNVVEIAARGLLFDGPSEVPAGWTTFRFRNESAMVHFAVIERVPEGQGVASQQEQIAPVFQDGMDLLNAGDVDGAMARFGELPPWFGEIVFLGGPGLTAPGRMSEATVLLEPGTYLIECYVKTDGVFHSYNPDPATFGMVHELRVLPEATDAEEPSPTVRLEISSAGGITASSVPAAGPHTVGVTFTDQVAHENFVGHDVHLARMPEGTDIYELEAWMDWTQEGGLATPAPVEFIGGLNEMPGGSTGYFHVVLAPGSYAWVSEVPGSVDKGMLLPFRVGDAP